MAGVMSRYAAIIRWTLGAVALAVAALLVLILIAPRLINIESVQQALEATLSQEIGGEVTFQSIRLSILPRPHVAVIEGRLSVPDAFGAEWESLSMSARLLPLFIGRVELGVVSVERPEITVTVAPERAETGDNRHPSTAGAIVEKLKPLAGIAAAGKDLVIILKAGRLNLHVKDRFDLIFSDMDGRVDVPPERIQISLKTRTEFCEKIELQANASLETFNSRGRIDLTGFRPQRLPPNLFGADTSWLGESLINLSFDFKTDGANRLEALMQGSVPQLTVSRGGGAVELRATSFKAQIQKDERQMEISLTEGILEHPKLTLSGKFLRRQDAGKLEMELNAAGVDVASIRQTAPALAGETAALKAVFDIVRGGRVSALSFSSRGNSLTDLAKLENMSLSAGLSEGIIRVPGIRLDVADVSAHVTISDNLLKAEGLEGRTDTSAVHDGSLRLGLKGENAPFHLDIGLDADLAKVHGVMRRIVTNPQVLRKMDRITVVSGRADGRLILGETLKDIAATVKVSDFTLSARVDPIPAALIFKGKDFAYSAGALTVGRLEGRLKKSAFALGPFRLNWQEAPLMDIQSGSAELQLNELYTVLSSFANLKNTLNSIASINGAVTLSRLQASGPLAAPADWDYQADGSARNVQLNSERLPAPLSVRRGGFRATPRVLTISQAEIAIMDAALTGSARLTEYRKSLQAADLSFEGTVGPMANQWLQQRIGMPAHLTVRPPLLFSNGRLGWQRSGWTAFSGDLTIQNSLKVSTDVVIEPDRVNIKKFVVEDKDSTAEFTFNLRKGREIDFGFRGNLQKPTLDKLLADNRILNGRVEGDFRLTYAIGRPMDTRFSGTLSAKDLILTERLGMPAAVNSLSVAAADGKFDIAADMLFEEDKAVKLTGQVDHSPQGIVFDTDMTSSGIVLDDLLKALAKNGKKEDGKKEKGKEEKGASGDNFWEFPVEGKLNLDAAYVTYGSYTWRPLRAALSLKPGEIAVTISDAALCGISTPGTLILTPKDVRLNFEPVASDQELSYSAPCLMGRDTKTEGRYVLTGMVTGHGPREDLLRSLSGSAEISVGNGRLYAGRTYRVLKNILDLLNITEIYRGKLPDIAQEGFGFKSVNAKIKLENDSLFIEEGFIDGLSMGVAVSGALSLADEGLDMTVLVAPLKTVDKIVNMIPLVGDILGGSLISVPVGVKGTLTNPDVTILPPAAIGEGLLRILKRTLKLPVKVIQPLIPKKEE